MNITNVTTKEVNYLQTKFPDNKKFFEVLMVEKGLFLYLHRIKAFGDQGCLHN